MGCGRASYGDCSLRYHTSRIATASLLNELLGNCMDFIFHFLALHCPKVTPKTVAAAIGVIGAWILFSQAGAVVLSWFEFAHFGLLVAHTSLTALTIQAVAIYSHAVFLRNARCIILLIAFVMAGAITAILIRLAVGIYLAGCVAVLHHGGVWVLLACHFVR